MELEHAIASTSALAHAEQSPRSLVWAGRVLTGLIVAFLLVDALGKLIPLAPYVEGTTELGYAKTLVRPLGLVLAILVLLHLVPRTQFFGALLLTASGLRSRPTSARGCRGSTPSSVRAEPAKNPQEHKHSTGELG